MVIKKSETSNTTYLLFLNDEALEKFWPLDPKSTIQDETVFSYKEKDTHIHVNKETQRGKITSEYLLIRGEKSITITNCKEV